MADNPSIGPCKHRPNQPGNQDHDPNKCGEVGQDHWPPRGKVLHPLRHGISQLGTTLPAVTRQRRVPLTKRNILRTLLKLTLYPPLDLWEQNENNVLHMFQHRGDGYVEDIRGRSGGAGVDYAVCRDDRGLGAADPSALTLQPRRWADGREGMGWGKAGWRATIAACAWTPRPCPPPTAG